ncbi:MAG: hypothetical protein IK062_11145, partial [Selenomonadaceae bacterium]|nr:hypothetical protein [Selenomonadaceae bacterium]
MKNNFVFDLQRFAEQTITDSKIDLTSTTEDTDFTKNGVTVAHFDFSTTTLTKVGNADVSDITVTIDDNAEYILDKEFREITDGTNTFIVASTSNTSTIVKGNKITSGTIYKIKLTDGNTCVYTGKTYTRSGDKVLAVLNGTAYIYDYVEADGGLSPSEHVAGITGLSSTVTTDNFSVDNSTVKLQAAALGTSEIKISRTGDYTLALADGVSSETDLAASWIVSNGTAEYYETGTATYTAATDGKSIAYSVTGTTSATITGLSSNAVKEDLVTDGNVVTLNSAALDPNQKVTISDDYTLALASDVPQSTTTAAGFTVSGITAKYSKGETTAGYVLSGDKKSVTYTTASSGETLFTIEGLKKDTKASDLSLKDKTVTLNSAALDPNQKVTISGDYTLALASDVPQSTTTAAGFTVSGTTAKYSKGRTTAGYVLSGDKKSVTYTTASSGETLFTIKGLNEDTKASDLSLKDKTVTLNSAALDKKQKVTISDGYTLALAEDVTQSKKVKKGFTVNGTSAKYYGEGGITAGYALSDDKKSVTHKSATTGILFTISGLKKDTNASYLSLKDTTVTLKSGALNKNQKVTISKGKGYTLALASSVPQSKKFKKRFKVSGTTAKYYSKDGITAGYTLSDDKRTVTYVNAGGGTLFTIKGLKKGTKSSKLSLKDKTVTLYSGALDPNQKVTISKDKGYTLALAKDVSKPKKFSAGFTVEGTTAKYYSKDGITAGYTLSDDKRTVAYKEATTKTLFTIEGLKKDTKASDLSLKDKTVTLNSEALDKNQKVTISDGYTLALAKDVTQSKKFSAGFKVSGTTAKYYSKDGITAGYTLSDDKRT